METLSSIKLERGMPMVEQLSAKVRQYLKEGVYQPGTKLPSTAELARMWESDVRTVHRAMAILVKEGLLRRKPGSGTFVRERSEVLTRVAIYCSRELLGARGSLYAQSLQSALDAELKEKGLEVQHWVDSRSEGKTREPWASLMNAARRRDFQAVIVPMTDLSQLGWLSKLPVPTAFHCSEDISNGVKFDQNQLIELGLEKLASQGCRSVGLISPLATHVLKKTQLHHPNEEFYKIFTEIACSKGLEIRNEWMYAAHHEDDLRNVTHEQFGYQQFNKLWQCAEKPDGLFVYPDSVVRGVLMGIARHGVRVPEELKLVLHKNAGSDLLCPFRADFVVSDEREVAAALAGQIIRQAQGQNVVTQYIRFHLSESRPEDLSLPNHNKKALAKSK